MRSEELLKESSVGYAHAALFDFILRFAKGSGCSGHLIHRGAVPLPLKGKDNTPLDLGRDLQWRAHMATAGPHPPQAVPLPLRGEGISAV